MKSDDARPPYETSEIGTPRDYTDDLYRYYFEVGEIDGRAERILREYLGEARAAGLKRLTHGFELVAPLQSAPDIVRQLAQANIAVYQVVRYAKVAGA